MRKNQQCQQPETMEYLARRRRVLLWSPCPTSSVPCNILSKRYFTSLSIFPSYLQHGYSGLRLCSTSTSSTSSRFQPGKRKGLILLLLGLIPVGFVWYYTGRSDENTAASIITAVKRELLKGQYAQRRQNYQTAEKRYHKALELLSNPIIAREQEGLEARSVSLDKLANLYLEEKKWVESENTFRELMREMLRAGAAKDSNEFVEISLKLARIYHNQNRYEVAEAGFDWCVSTMREKCAEEKTDERLAMLCMSLLHRATYYSYVERHTEAITDYTEQVNISENVYGKESIQVAVANSNLAVAVDAANNGDRALQLIQTSVAMAETLLKDVTSSEDKEKIKTNMASFYVNLATIQSNKGQYSLALEAYNQAEALIKKYPDEEIAMQIRGGRKICNTKLSNQ